jgi:hypothetical protein
MRGLIAFFITSVSVSVACIALTASVYGQGTGEVPIPKQVDASVRQLVCQNDATATTDPKGHFQCNVCPSYTDFHGNHEGYALNQAFYGHFSAANADQLLLVMWGCEPHVAGFGGSILLTRDGAVWKQSAYFQGDKPIQCLSFNGRDGLNRLVCRGADAHFGNADYWISAKSYEGGSVHDQPLLAVGSNLGSGSPISGFCYDQDIDRFEKLPSGEGFTVVIKQTKGLAPSGEAACGERDIPMEPTQTVKLIFQFDGDRFAPALGGEGSLEKVANFVPRQ